MAARIDLSGQIFGRLRVLSRGKKVVYKVGIRWYWKCICECGKQTQCTSSDLKKGKTKSCGCLKGELTSKRNVTHGLSGSSEYRIWQSMKDRCINPNCEFYYCYGVRGIKVCDRWLNSFENFYADMGPRPSKDHSIDRFPNINGHYEASNCRWGTEEQQARGKRNNRWLECKGKKMVAQDWANLIGIDSSTLFFHLTKRTFPETIEYFEKKKGITIV
jgi:hypothetical protein